MASLGGPRELKSKCQSPVSRFSSSSDGSEVPFGDVEVFEHGRLRHWLDLI